MNLAMGNYGVYVWTAYAITFFVFGALLFTTLKEKKYVKKVLQQYFTQVNQKK